MIKSNSIILLIAFLLSFATISNELNGQEGANLNNFNISTVNVNDMTDSEILKIKGEISKRGLTTTQFKTAALLEGVSQTEIDKLVMRMENVSSEAGNSESSIISSNAKVTQNLSKKVKVNNEEQALTLFGFDLFNTDKLSFESDQTIPVSDSYILSAGDQVSISIWGDSEMSYQLEVKKDGAIYVPRIGSISVKGNRLSTVKTKIISQLKTIYNGLGGVDPNTFCSITVSSAGSIKVNVIGDALKPGTYTVSAASSIFNALYLSGGPGKNGSFRDIQLVRDGKTIAHLDIYDYLLNADMSGDMQLRAGDIIFIPAYKKRVAIAGEVKREAIFELLPEETIEDIITMTGGFTSTAYKESLTVNRVTDSEREIKTVTALNFADFSTKDGDYITVSPILDRFANRVTIEGAVFKPGDYELSAGMKLSDLIAMAEGVKEDAFKNRATILRLQSDNQLESEVFDLSEILSGKKDIVLKREDLVKINSIFDIKESQTLNVYGEVQHPGQFIYAEGLTLGDLILKSGGFKEKADLSYIEVVRRLSVDEISEISDKISHSFTFKLDRDLKLSEESANFKLSPFDAVYVRKAPGYHNRGNVTILGEIQYAGTYSILNKSDKVSDIVKRAGGVLSEAYVKGAYLKRAVAEDELDSKQDLLEMDSLVEIKPTSNIVALDLEMILNDENAVGNLTLQDGDQIVIPRFIETVSIGGAVMNSTSVVHSGSVKLRSYIDRAGGFNNNAKKNKVYVIYPNGDIKSTKSFLGMRAYPKVEPGCEIVVGEKPERENSSAMWVSIASATSSLVVSVITVITLTK